MCGDENVIYSDGVQDDLLKKFPYLEKCERFVQVPGDVVPFLRAGGSDFLTETLRRGFLVNYMIHNNKSNKSIKKTKLIIGLFVKCKCSSCRIADMRDSFLFKTQVINLAGLLICVTVFFLRHKSSTLQRHFGVTTKRNKNIEVFLKNHGVTLKRYKLSHVKKMTKGFKAKLGQGSFGVVYEGKLPNGAPVAVKILNESKKNGEDFMNEVASISKTSHVNVVTLLGFCLEGHKRALIYEFMSKGSLDKFIYRKGDETITPLSWEIMYQISMGIARGLEYLHIGSSTRIFHFDIKPHNILLDKNFCPKISVFGLAKLCSRNESIISMSNARGTMGYVAPEMWNRHLGGVSHKSDVYSYGMMLLEMVGGRKNIIAEATQTSEIYFPNWVYKRLELGNDLRLDELMTPEETDIAKRLAIVGLWCIHTFPNDRPTMSRVVGMLEGSMNSLEIPPKLLFSSPTSSPPESSIH